MDGVDDKNHKKECPKMTGNFDKVVAVIDYLGLNPNINEYKGRFLLQKITFLAQSLGVSTDYGFTPYISGPYSTELTTDYYSQNEELSSHRTNYQLTASEISSLDKIREYCDLDGSLALLESTSTFVYILNQESRSEDDDAFVRSKALKPHFSDSQLIIGMTKAKQLLFREEYLTDELKQETDIWEKLE
ncbi:MAG: hypothetical protein NWE89_02185 [Candidatus Bathyarchaeota archaeon]|nr:hypothetical protein [Candidatus Bathyarchaeota archaeon]